MKSLAMGIRVALCILATGTMWKLVRSWAERGGNASSAVGIPGARRAVSHAGVAGGATFGPRPATPARVPFPSEDAPVFRQGALTVPIARLRPREGVSWAMHAVHFLVEQMPSRGAACVSTVGTLVHVGEVSLRLEMAARPARSRLAALSSQAGEPFQFALYARADFLRLFPSGLSPCSEWVDASGISTAREPGLLRLHLGSRRVLASRSLASVRVVRGDAVALARHPLRDAYEISAERAGESLLALSHLPGPHVRFLRVRVDTPMPHAQAVRAAPLSIPPAPGHGRFLVPGWTAAGTSR